MTRTAIPRPLARCERARWIDGDATALDVVANAGRPSVMATRDRPMRLGAAALRDAGGAEDVARVRVTRVIATAESRSRPRRVMVCERAR